MRSLVGVLKGTSIAFRLRELPLRAYFALLVAVFIGAAVAATLFVDRQAERQARADAVTSAGQAADIAAAQLGSHVSLLRTSVAQLASNPAIGRVFANPGGCSLVYQGLGGTAVGPDLGHIDIVGADGSVVCSSRKVGVEVYAGTAWLRRALGKSILEAPAFDSATGAQVAVVAAPITGGKGVVAGFTDLSSAGQRLVSLYGGGGSVEFLITTRDRRTVLARSIDPDDWVGEPLRSTAFATDANRTERRDLDGNVRLYAQSAMPGLGWRLFAGEDKADALTDAKTLRTTQLQIIAAGLLAFLIAAWFGYRNIAAPIRRLSAELRSRRGASFRSPIPVSGPAEVAALAEDFNGLMTAVERELRHRKKAQEVAGSAERNYRLLFESNPNPMWVYDKETLRFLAVNERAIRDYGYSRDDFLAMTIDQIRNPAEVERLHALVNAQPSLTERGFVDSGVWHHRRKDGSLFDVDVISDGLEFEGRAARVVLAHDVSERVRAEEALRSSEARYRDLFENASDLIATVDLEGRLTAVNEAFVTHGRLQPRRADGQIARRVRP